MSVFKKFQQILVILLVAVAAFFGGNYYGKRGYFIEIKKSPPLVKILNKTTTASEVDFSRFWEVWDMVSGLYLDRPVDPQKMLQGAISGMVSSLGDPYTSYLPPQVNTTVNNALNGTYQGIGAELGIKDNQLIVVSPLDGSPAKAAGVRAGDKILEIEGESTAGVSLTEAVARIRGDAGTLSTLTLQRDSQEPFKVYIKRGVINIASVIWEDKGEGTVYIRLSRFGADTETDWSKVISEINVSVDELDAIILDLRGNPGGYMNAAVFIAGDFVKRNEVVLYQESALGEFTPFETTRIGTFQNIPALFVLIDEGSASASEILAAALKVHANATLVGTTSFGKGTIQDARNFSDGSGVHITIAKWLTPNRQWIHGKGLNPDVIVERTAEEVTNGVDSQLNKALELAGQI